MTLAGSLTESQSRVDTYGQKKKWRLVVKYILIVQMFLFYCLHFSEKHIREFPRSNGLLRSEEQSDRQPHWSSFSCCGGRTRLEGTNNFIFLKWFWLESFHPRSWDFIFVCFFFFSLLRRKDVCAWGITVAPLPHPRALLWIWVCLLSVFVSQLVENQIDVPPDRVAWDKMGSACNEIMIMSDKQTLSSCSYPSVPAMVSSQNF